MKGSCGFLEESVMCRFFFVVVVEEKKKIIDLPL